MEDIANSSCVLSATSYLLETVTKWEVMLEEALIVKAVLPTRTQLNIVSNAVRVPGGPDHPPFRSALVYTSTPISRISIFPRVPKSGSASARPEWWFQFMPWCMGWRGRSQIARGMTIVKTASFLSGDFVEWMFKVYIAMDCKGDCRDSPAMPDILRLWSDRGKFKQWHKGGWGGGIKSQALLKESFQDLARIWHVIRKSLEAILTIMVTWEEDTVYSVGDVVWGLTRGDSRWRRVRWGFGHLWQRLRLGHCLKKWPGWRRFVQHLLFRSTDTILSWSNDLNWEQAYSGCLLVLQRMRLVSELLALAVNNMTDCWFRFRANHLKGLSWTLRLMNSRML